MKGGTPMKGHIISPRLKNILTVSISLFIIALSVATAASIYREYHRMWRAVEAFNCASVTGDAICRHIEKHKKVPLKWEDIYTQARESGLNFECAESGHLEDIVIVDFQRLKNLPCNETDHENLFIIPAEDPSFAKIGITPINEQILKAYRHNVCGNRVYQANK